MENPIKMDHLGDTTIFGNLKITKGKDGYLERVQLEGNKNVVQYSTYNYLCYEV